MRFARAGGRLVVLAIVAGALGIVGVQFEHAIASNVALGRELDHMNRDVAELKVRKARELRDVRRLEDPEGSEPEIHARLRLVGPHEQLIFVRYSTSVRGALESPAPAVDTRTGDAAGDR